MLFIIRCDPVVIACSPSMMTLQLATCLLAVAPLSVPVPLYSSSVSSCLPGGFNGPLTSIIYVTPGVASRFRALILCIYGKDLFVQWPMTCFFSARPLKSQVAASCIFVLAITNELKPWPKPKGLQIYKEYKHVLRSTDGLNQQKQNIANERSSKHSTKEMETLIMTLNLNIGHHTDTQPHSPHPPRHSHSWQHHIWTDNSLAKP